MRNVSVGIVGAGEITRKIHLPVLLGMPGVDVAWLSDNRAQQAQILGAAYKVKSLCAPDPETLPACDVALLAIPVGARADYLRVFADRHTAVLCEKPFAASASEHRRLVEAFPLYGLGAGYMRRFYHSTTVLREVLHRGWFGPLQRICIAEGDRSKGSGVDHSFLDDPRAGAARGVLFDLGTHTIDLALYITGAVGYQIRSCEVVFDGAVDRKVAAQIALQSPYAQTGRDVELDYCVSWLDRQRNTLQLEFEHAVVWAATGPAAGVFLGDPAQPARCVALTGPGGATTPNQAFYLQWRAFLDALQGQTESPISAGSAVLTTGLVEDLLVRGRDAHG